MKVGRSPDLQEGASELETRCLWEPFSLDLRAGKGASGRGESASVRSTQRRRKPSGLHVEAGSEIE